MRKDAYTMNSRRIVSSKNVVKRRLETENSDTDNGPEVN